MPSQRKTTTPSPQQALSGQGVPRIPGKYAIAEGCCRKIQNGPSMVLRLGTLNVGSLTGRIMEIAEMLERRIDICCLQETRWKSNGVCHVNSDKEKYKLFWNGQKTAKNGVGIFVRKLLAQEVLDIKRINSHGKRILEFAESHGFCLLNTYFRKRLEHLITCKSGPSATQIDFFAVKQPHRRLFKNVKVIPGESCLKFELLLKSNEPIDCSIISGLSSGYDNVVYVDNDVRFEHKNDSELSHVFG
ncbi:hypothetical protein HELRODRAFT_160100 [Helobdella robusta]|uniref:Endonuclease/exonuclease/phosphatase domain-containing protein n=1 Tax=Helobdella robusta TaxID=6412 RepID=T1EPS4_HELRO|nr:hypothetical protein HELRODRAFT_160100 [Helobdella robusta]ESO05995.1 hypothetical protein HELRODRAFT_160100 [Helobdella robusta]